VALGGDHTITLPLRAGPPQSALGLLHFDGMSTPGRKASASSGATARRSITIEEGLADRHMIQVGFARRSPRYLRVTVGKVTIVTAEEVHEAPAVAERIRARSARGLLSELRHRRA
jgi:arginase family enzyme